MVAGGEVPPGVFNYAKLLSRLSERNLTPNQREKNKRIPPPQEELAAMFGYDSNLHRLYIIDGDMPRYVSDEDLFVLINGRSYAIWRVKSMLLLGNPDCVPPNYEKLKEFQPPNKPMAPIPPERKR